MTPLKIRRIYLDINEADDIVIRMMTRKTYMTKKSHQYLYDLLLERVWKRTLDACGIRYRKLYSQRHTFLSHMLASGNSPADVAAIAGHRLDELLKTYAKPTGRLKLVDW